MSQWRLPLRGGVEQNEYLSKLRADYGRSGAGAGQSRRDHSDSTLYTLTSDSTAYNSSSSQQISSEATNHTQEI